MYKFAITLVGLTASIAAGVYIAEDVIPEASRAAANETFVRITDAAYLYTELGYSLEEALTEAVATARKAEAVSVEGTRLTWRHGDECYTTVIVNLYDNPGAASC